MGVGKEAIRKGLVEGGGAKVVGSESSGLDAGSSPLIQAVMDAFSMLHPPSDMADGLDLSQESDIIFSQRLRTTLGDFFANRLAGDATWARGVLGVTPASSP